MKFALSTNWCNRRLTSGEEIADAAAELGFDGLELGFHTTDEQVGGFKARLDRMPVWSVHAFAPVPLSAPQGYPELYQLASLDEVARRIARCQVLRNVAFAADMGADTLVLHAGRVSADGLFRRQNLELRRKNGVKMLDVFKRELATLAPELERRRVTLALENLPYLEGFPAEWELEAVCGEWVKGWFDTGHDFVRRTRGWTDGEPLPGELFAGMHVHDSRGGDDHLAPGEGQIDFASLAALAKSVRHVVFEPGAFVPAESLRRGLDFARSLWENGN